MDTLKRSNEVSVFITSDIKVELYIAYFKWQFHPLLQDLHKFKKTFKLGKITRTKLLSYQLNLQQNYNEARSHFINTHYYKN